MTWFGSAYVTIDAPAVPPGLTGAEARFLHRALGVEPGAVVLDVGCGTGRHLPAMTTYGYRVIAIDPEPAAVEQARHTAADLVTVDVRQVDAQSFTGPRVDAAYSMMSPLGFDTTTDQDRSFLTAIRDTLDHGARFVLDYPNLLGVRDTLDTCQQHQLPDGTRVVRVHNFNPLTSTSSRLRVVHAADGTEVGNDHSTVRMYHPHEIHNLLQVARFTVRGVYGGADAGPHTTTSRRVLVVAEAS